ncbi:glycosyltransferase family 2 protein [Candidatus Clostridium helianthi]|uniref:Glycosyltransferase family 2 protein n=1 Tax=Candidatus Clostridium helianthi TaxID=3381660 RepID=A0ABW8RY90_9CLOT
MCNKLVSVVMCCYNEEIQWVKKSIESLINQEYKNLEIIIVNDNPDNLDIISLLTRYLKIDRRIKVLFNNKNIGLVKSLNKALLECNGEYIARMDADDVSKLNRIKKQVEFMEKNNEVGLVMSYANFIDEFDNKIGEQRNTPIKFEQIKKILMYKNVAVHPTWLFRKSILSKLKRYNECMYVEDYEFLCRAIINGIILETLPEFLLDYRVRKTSICNSNRLFQQINFQTINKSYIAALKGKPYCILENFDSNNLKNLKYLKFTQDNIYRGKVLINEKKYIKGSILIFFNVIGNRYKINQLINEIKYRMNLKFLNNNFT